jgi:hypothetical protein
VPTAVISSDYERRTHLPIICLVFNIKRQLAMGLASFVPFNHAHDGLRIGGASHLAVKA